MTGDDDCNHETVIHDYLGESEACMACGTPLEVALLGYVDAPGMPAATVRAVLPCLAGHQPGRRAAAIVATLSVIVVRGQRDAYNESQNALHMKRWSRARKRKAAIARSVRSLASQLLGELRGEGAFVLGDRDESGETPQWSALLGGLEKIATAVDRQDHPPLSPGARGKAAARKLRDDVVWCLARWKVPTGGQRAARIFGLCHQAAFGGKPRSLKATTREVMRAREALRLGAGRTRAEMK